MFVKPKEGLKVRDPVSYKHLPDEGAEVPETSYWVRCLISGDVVQVEPIPDSAESAPEGKE